MIGSAYLSFTVLLATLSATPARQQMDLNGSWQFQKVSELSTPPETGEWQRIQIPGTFRGYDYERVWLRRSFTLPESMRGQRITIQFDGVKYNSRILVNGQRVGGCFNGYDAFEVDATDAVRFDGPNQLDVGCHDWTGVFSEGKFDFSKKPAWQRPRRYVTDKVIAPIGGHYDQYGIWGDVTLVAHPAVYVKDLFIKPSVRRQELVVEFTVANETNQDADVQLAAAVEDHEQDVLTLPQAAIHVTARGTVTRTIRQAWPGAHYWSHEDPYLYHLRTELSSGDRLRTRFGFREFWIEGHRYVLNGSKINLLASSWWPPTEAMSRADVKERWLALKAAGVICFRTHTQPWRRVHYEVADEVGLLMIIEGAMWHDPYCTRYDDPRYWENYAKMIHAMIEREKNRPSVIMWSMENEAYAGDEKTKLAIAGLSRVGRMAKQWDPTRPIYFESDGDPGGVADAIGMHYVHEYPKYTCWPNEAYWLEKPFHPRTWFGNNKEAFVWKKTKPLYIGEFLWVPSGTPAAHTVFFGDDAYRNLDEYTRRAKAEAWKMQILAFRHDEAGGMCPWTVGTDLTTDNPLYRAHQYAYQSIAAYCHDYDRRFYAGEEVTRRVEVFNDVLSASDLRLRWTLSQDGKIIANSQRVLSLDAGEKTELEIVLPMPNVSARTELAWRLVLVRDGRTVFEDTHEYSVFPPLQVGHMSHVVGLFDPAGRTERLFQELGINFRPIKSLRTIGAEINVLVIGDGTLSKSQQANPVIGRVDPQRGAIRDFVARGGRLVVLRQDAYPEGLFDLQPTIHESTMTFPLGPSHPALRGLRSEDLKFWRGDHMVADHELSRPSVGASRSIVVSGSNTGIDHAPLLERPQGQGCIVHCQMRLVEKALTEPAAGIILRNVLHYAEHYQPHSRRTLVLGGDDEYHQQLAELGLRFDTVNKGASPADPARYSLIIVRGDASIPASWTRQLDAAIRGGCRLLVHRPAARTMDRLRELLGVDETLRQASGSVTRSDGDHPLLEALTREDLYWTVKRPGLSWARQPLSREMIDGLFSPAFDASGATRYEIADWNAKGQVVKADGSGILFASAGTAEGEISFPETGRYGIGIRARGTPCRGVYPMARIAIDGTSWGVVQLQGDAWQELGVYGEAKQGRHRVTVEFVNDASDPPREDRNLHVDQVLVVRDHRATHTFNLTSPAALVAQDVGQGMIVWDAIRWDTEEGNGRKAARHACSLLTALGADFTPRSTVTLECERMTPQAEMKYFHTEGSTAYMGCNGYLLTQIQVAESRRYAAQLVASGDASESICPLVEIHLDGRKLAQVQLTTEGWRSYPLELELPQGNHELAIWFVNDHSSPSGDRNLRLDKLVIDNQPQEHGSHE